MSAFSHGTPRCPELGRRSVRGGSHKVCLDETCGFERSYLFGDWQMITDWHRRWRGCCRILACCFFTISSLPFFQYTYRGLLFPQNEFSLNETIIRLMSYKRPQISV